MNKLSKSSRKLNVETEDQYPKRIKQTQMDQPIDLVTQKQSKFNHSDRSYQFSEMSMGIDHSMNNSTRRTDVGIKSPNKQSQKYYNITSPKRTQPIQTASQKIAVQQANKNKNNQSQNQLTRNLNLSIDKLEYLSKMVIEKEMELQNIQDEQEPIYNTKQIVEKKKQKPAVTPQHRKDGYVPIHLRFEQESEKKKQWIGNQQKLEAEKFRKVPIQVVVKRFDDFLEKQDKLAKEKNDKNMDRRIAKEFKGQKDLTFRPNLDSNSKKIIGKQLKREKNFSQRLLTAPATRAKSQSVKEFDQNLTFHPLISPKSRQLARLNDERNNKLRQEYQ